MITLSECKLSIAALLSENQPVDLAGKESEPMDQLELQPIGFHAWGVGMDRINPP
jgi:hypothetical protein